MIRFINYNYMKLFLLVAFAGIGLSASAQETPLIKKLQFPNGQNAVTGIDTTGERYRQLKGLIELRSQLPPATYSHSTPGGKVYIMPVDNMPCLVPDMKQVRRMPGVYVTPDSRMPNAIPKQPLINK